MITPTRRFLLAAATTAALLLSAACGDTSETQPRASSSSKLPSSPSPAAAASDPTLDYSDPAAVCRAFARTALTVDTTTDGDPDDAYRRAAPYLTYERYDQLQKQPATRNSPEWDTWKQHKVQTQVTLAPFAGDSSGLQAQRAFSVLADATPVGRDGWRGPTEHHAVHCGLNTQDSQWRVAAFDVEDLPS